MIHVVKLYIYNISCVVHLLSVFTWILYWESVCIRYIDDVHNCFSIGLYES